MKALSKKSAYLPILSSAGVPGSSFFRENVTNLVRFHFAKQEATLSAALDRLSDIRKMLTAR